MKITRIALITVLSFSALLQLALGCWILVDMQGVAESFQLEYSGISALSFLACFFGLTLIAVSALSVWTAWWVSRGEPFGIYLSLYHGLMLIGIGMGGSMLTGRPDGLLIDVARGALILGLALALGRQTRLWADSSVSFS